MTNSSVTINSHVWFRKSQVSDDFVDFLRDSLTVRHRYDKDSLVDCLEDSGSHWGVPLAFADRELSSHLKNVRDVRPSLDVRSPEFKDIPDSIPLGGSSSWDWQIQTVPAIAQQLRKDRRAILKAPCGAGKTRASLAIAAALGVPTLIVVDRGFLANQWKKNIQDLFGLDESQIGHVQQDLCDFENKPFTVVMAQSLMDRGGEEGYQRYPEEFYNAFGLVIFDELHGFAAPKLNRVMRVVNAGARLGLSATPFRADGLEPVYQHHLGSHIEEVTITREPAKIYMIHMKDYIPNMKDDMAKSILINRITGTGKPTKKQVKDLGLKKSQASKSISKPHAGSKARNEIIVDELMRALDGNRKILVLSDRIAHLEELHRLVEQKTDTTQDFFIGKRSQDELDEAEHAQVIYATYSMASQAMDIKSLDTLFMVTPRSNVEQAVGRILRTDPNKKSPIVVDFVDPKFYYGASTRYNWYLSNNYQVFEVNRQ